MRAKAPVNIDEDILDVKEKKKKSKMKPAATLGAMHVCPIKGHGFIFIVSIAAERFTGFF